MHIFQASVRLYRKTVKRFRLIHVLAHWVMNRLVIPFLELRKGFKTIPDDPFWFRLELLTDQHETETTLIIDQRVKSGMTVLDIGAHVGYYARRCAERVGEQGRVIAFEPHPRTFAMLQQNVKNRANVTPIQAALAETEGTAELYDYLMMSASGSLHYDESMRDLQQSQLSDSDIAPRIDSEFQVQKFSVRTVSVDACLEELGIQKVDVVKMDIEGAEIGALHGMKQTIANSPDLALIMEYNPQAWQAFGHEPKAAFSEVLGMGFNRAQIIQDDGSLFDLMQDETTITQLTERLINHMGVVNLLLTRGD
jgi:FkbM family methyltransferase